MKTIAIRTDASTEIGTGHVMRCMTLANQLKKFGADIFFICRDLDGNLILLLKKKGFTVLILNRPEEANIINIWKWYKLKWERDAKETIAEIKNSDQRVSLLIVDHYGLDEKWESAVGKHVDHMMVIDDLANRKHYCDFLLDQNIYDNFLGRYNELVPNSCMKFLGPDYMLFRNEFFNYHNRIRSGAVSNVLVSFGGSDPRNETVRVLKILATLKNDFTVDVVVGQTNHYRKEIQFLCDQFKKFNYHCQVDNMAQLIDKADISFGAGGTSMWERCFLGLPSLVISLADNQVEIAKIAQKLGAVIYLGDSALLTNEQIIGHFHQILAQPNIITKLSQAASDIFNRNKIESLYVAERIIEAIK